MTHPIWIRQKDGLAFRDVPTHQGGRMPDFCIIGSAKCGTSALNAMLAKQPGFAMSFIKESHYFSTDAMLEKGDDWYRGLYHAAKPGQLLGEASTSYTRYPLVDGTAARMAAANPDMKLIYVIREPLKRTESECLQTLKYTRNVLGEDNTHMSLDEYYDMIEDPTHPHHTAIFSTSCYIDQIEAFDAHFPKENMLVLMQDDLKRDGAAVLERVCDFLGADKGALVSADLVRNATAGWQESLDRERGASKFQKIPSYDTLKNFVPAGIKSRLLNAAAGGETANRLAFSETRRAELTEKFREPNQRLQERIGTLPADWST